MAVKQVRQKSIGHSLLGYLVRHKYWTLNGTAILLTALFAACITAIFTRLSVYFTFEWSAASFFLFSFGNLLLFKLLQVRLGPQIARILYPEQAVYQHIIAEYSQSVPDVSDLGELLQSITHILQSRLNVASASVWLYHPKDRMMYLARVEGRPGTFELAELPVDLALTHLQGSKLSAMLPESALRRGLITLNIETITAIRLQDELIGLVGLGKHHLGQPHSDDVLQVLDLMAGQSALAVKNACLITDLEDTLSNLQLAYRRTIDAQEEERRNLASELHDDILGRLTTMTLTLRHSRTYLASDPEQVRQWLEMLETETQDINARLREITQGLHPSVLTDLGLISALRAYLDSLAKQSLPPSAPQAITLTAQGFGAERMKNQKLERDLYSITRQALDNALKHAHADQVFIHLRWQDDTINLTVRDTGCGLKDDPEVLIGKNGRLGLLSMNERARAWQGNLTFHSNPGEGTTILAQLPINQPSSAPTHLQAFTQHLARSKATSTTN